MEEWKPVVGYEDEYEVSSLGRVRSLDRIVNRPGHPKSETFRAKGKILRPFKGNKHGHLAVGISGRHEYVHRLVFEAFVGPADGRLCLHGLKGTNDNSLANLRYGTSADNIRDMLDFGSPNFQELKLADKLSEIKSRLQSGESQDRIAASLGVAQSTISRTLKLSSTTPR